MPLRCVMCSHSFESENELIAHVCRFHKYHRRFRVSCKCFRTFTNWSSFLTHLRRRGCCKSLSAPFSPLTETSQSNHTTEPSLRERDVTVETSGQSMEVDTDCNSSSDNTHVQAAAYILGLKE